jgi:glycerate dehydrogenase
MSACPQPRKAIGMTLQQGAFLDFDSVHPADLERSALEAALPRWQLYPSTAAAEVSGRVAGCDVVVSNKVVLSREVLAAAERLRLVCVAATGTNNVDLEAARELGIAVSNVTGYATPAVTQHVFALLLALTTRLDEHRRAARDGTWSRSPYFCVLDFPFRELAGRTMGIVGYGELGRGVARAAEAFGMQVLVAQRPGGAAQAGRLPLDELLRQADVVSLHLPLAANTRNLIGAREFALMKPDAVLINTARGGIVDESALLAALQSGRLGGAGIDVLAVEPPPADQPLLQADLPNLIVTPHVAWASRAARQRMLDDVAANIRAFARGEARNRVV